MANFISDIFKQMFNRQQKLVDSKNPNIGISIGDIDNIAAKYGLTKNLHTNYNNHYTIDYVIEGNIRIADGYNVILTVYTNRDSLKLCVMSFNQFYINPHGIVLIVKDGSVSTPLEELLPETIDTIIKESMAKVDECLAKAELIAIQKSKDDLFEQVGIQ